MGKNSGSSSSSSSSSSSVLKPPVRRQPSALGLNRSASSTSVTPSPAAAPAPATTPVMPAAAAPASGATPATTPAAATPTRPSDAAGRVPDVASKPAKPVPVAVHPSASASPSLSTPGAPAVVSTGEAQAPAPAASATDSAAASQRATSPADRQGPLLQGTLLPSLKSFTSTNAVTPGPQTFVPVRSPTSGALFAADGVSPMRSATDAPNASTPGRSRKKTSGKGADDVELARRKLAEYEAKRAEERNAARAHIDAVLGRLAQQRSEQAAKRARSAQKLRAQMATERAERLREVEMLRRRLAHQVEDATAAAAVAAGTMLSPSAGGVGGNGGGGGRGAENGTNRRSVVSLSVFHASAHGHKGAAARRGSESDEGDAGPAVGPATSAEDAERLKRFARQEARARKEAAIKLQAWARGVLVRRAEKAAGRLPASGHYVPRKIVTDSGLQLDAVMLYEGPVYNCETIVFNVNAVDLLTLIRLVTQPNSPNPTLARVLLMTHTSYLSTPSLVALLALRFNTMASRRIREFVETTLGHIQSAVLDFIALWIAEFPEVLLDPAGPGAVAMDSWLERQSRMRVSHQTPQIRQRLLELRAMMRPMRQQHARRLEPDAPFTNPRQVPAPSLLLGASAITRFSADQIHALEVARQLTVLDFEAFWCVSHLEFLKQAWCKDERHVKSPNLLKIIDRFNSTVNWAASEILKYATPRERAEQICLLLDVANNLLTIQNFSGLMAILTALQSAGVSRLKATFPLLPEDYEQIYAQLKDVMAMEHNYRNYRDRLRKIKPPAVPYFGVLLQDLTFMDDGNPTRVGAREHLLNMEKQQMNFEAVSAILELRSVGIAINRVDKIANYLAASGTMDEKAQYRESLALEPRDLKPKKMPKIEYTAQEGSLRPELELIDAHFLDDMMAQMSDRSYEDGQYIVRAGDVGHDMYFIKSGMCMVEIPSGKQFEMNQGSFFGEIALFMETQRTASVRAIGRVVTSSLSKDAAMLVLNKYPEMRAQMQRLGVERMLADFEGTKTAPPKWLDKLAKQQ